MASSLFVNKIWLTIKVAIQKNNIKIIIGDKISTNEFIVFFLKVYGSIENTLRYQ